MVYYNLLLLLSIPVKIAAAASCVLVIKGKLKWPLSGRSGLNAIPCDVSRRLLSLGTLAYH